MEGPEGQLAQDVLALDGAREVRISPQQLAVIKSPTVSWQEVEPGVLSAIERALGTKPEVIHQPLALRLI
jgi:hypothetical protein